MDITYDLLLDNLNTEFRVLCFGGNCSESLSHPAFYKLGTELHDHRVYLVTPDTLPPLNTLKRNCLLLCVGDLPALSYQHCGYPMMVIRDASPWAVFSEVLSIYERYEVWEQSLKDSTAADADFQTLLELTAPLVMNDITLIDDDLRVLAAVGFRIGPDGQAEIMQVVRNKSVIPADLLSKYSGYLKDFRNSRKPFYSVDGCYCANVFAGDRFLGNLSLYPRLKELRKSDSTIIDILLGYVADSMYKRVDATGWTLGRFEQIVGKIYRNEFVSAEELTEFAVSDDVPGKRYACIMVERFEGVQSGLSNECIAESISGSEKNPVPVIDGNRILLVKDFEDSSAADREAYWTELDKTLDELDLVGGVSTGFGNLSRLRFHSIQAESALLSIRSRKNTGKSGSRLCHFRSIAADYLLQNSAGVLPAEYVCPPELLDFRDYDKKSDVDYWKTLRCYLDTEMNVAECARLLNVHRNTMLQRIDKMQSILGSCLDSPDGRLWLRISLRLFDMEDSVDI